MKEMLNGFRMVYKKNSNSHQMWRVVDHIRDWYLGGERQSFHRIPSLLDRIVEVDPKAVVDWSSVGLGNTFQRALICLPLGYPLMPSFLSTTSCLRCLPHQKEEVPDSAFPGDLFRRRRESTDPMLGDCTC